MSRFSQKLVANFWLPLSIMTASKMDSASDLKKKSIGPFGGFLSIQDALPLRRGVYRRLNLHVFPYYISYVVRGSTIWIVGVAHANRRPEYWIRRVKQIE